ncbi:MAG: hypothetical protein WAX77_11250 [Methylococcaceae bacterium]
MKKIKSSRILEAVYETAKDLHGCGLLTDEEMQCYEEIAPPPVSVNLDSDVVAYFREKCGDNPNNLQILINDLLRKDIEIARRVII